MNWTNEVLLPILIITLTKFVIYKALFFKSKQKKFQFFLLAMKKSHLCVRVMVLTVQLLRHDAYYPIEAEIRAVDSQSDLIILL